MRGLEASAAARSCDVGGTEEEVVHHVLVLSISLPQALKLKVLSEAPLSPHSFPAPVCCYQTPP